MRAYLKNLFFSAIIICITAAANAQDTTQPKTNNAIGVKYDLISFNKNISKPLHFASLEYTRQLKKMPIIARLNYANRFAKSGIQMEADAYPVISKKIYAYINAGYSKDILLFPKYRTGFSMYISLPAAIEAEGGFRLLFFNSPTWIYTASIGKYYKKYWFNLSTFLSPDSNNVTQSYFLKGRFYLNDKDYIMMTLGTGISPDDRSNNILLTNNKLSTKKAELSIRKTFNKTNILLLNTGFIKQEIGIKKYSNQFTAGIGFQKLF